MNVKFYQEEGDEDMKTKILLKNGETIYTVGNSTAADILKVVKEHDYLIIGEEEGFILCTEIAGAFNVSK